MFARRRIAGSRRRRSRAYFGVGESARWCSSPLTARRGARGWYVAPLCFPIYSELSALQDWKQHRQFCKADATRSSVDCLNASNDTGETAVRRATLPDDIDSDKFEGRRPGHSIDVPMKNGSSIRLNSKTLGPKTMKELRKIAEDNQKR